MSQPVQLIILNTGADIPENALNVAVAQTVYECINYTGPIPRRNEYVRIGKTKHYRVIDVVYSYVHNKLESVTLYV